jgi:uncharacterized damage-inducible protein DinB
MEDLRYPIGKFSFDNALTPEHLRESIAQIAVAPARLRAAVEGLSNEQLEAPYRPGGWTVRQVVHHLPDSHLNAYIRIRFALTEEQPTIKPYDENLWAALPDARTAPIEISLSLLEALHRRWSLLLGSLTPADLARTFRHPEIGLMTVEKNIALYAWHGRHHVAHITGLRERMGW